MNVLAIFQQIGMPEILIILAVALFLFGAKRLPEIGKSLGKGIREFKTGVKGLGDDVREGMEDDAEPQRTKAKESSDG
ncbi:MAG TPA: twin-arginine translocase TatA/TatE family subunit [Actinomycetota bacterium]|nr:twin-arginine translocase TatA/TatE family subunit [Actinomycetota bacterium]